jgi:hypothetical protein
VAWFPARGGSFCVERLIFVDLGYESFQAKAYNGLRYGCDRPNRRRSHTRASNIGVAEGQNARSSDYRQSTRLTTPEVAQISHQSHCRPNSDTAISEVRARGEYVVSLPTPVTQPRRQIPRLAGLFHSLLRQALRECCHCGLACRRISVRRLAVFLMPKGERPHPRFSDRRDLPQRSGQGAS